MMKGQAYSFIVILIVIPLLIFLLGFLALSSEVSVQRTDRIVADQMSQVARNFEDDFTRAVQTSGRRALLAEINHVLLTGQPIDNSSLRTGELMLNGDLYGNFSLVMFNNTLEDWKAKILATPTGFTNNVSYSNFFIRNGDGFNLLVSLKLDINLSHTYSYSRIARSIVKEVNVSVEGLEDPLYFLNSGGSVKKQVSPYPFKSFAIKLATGTRAGNCTGPVTFGGGSGILVTQNASGLGGYTGIVSETSDLPSVGCYSVGNANVVNIVNQTIQEQNYSTLYLDQATGVWLLPISSGLVYYNMFPSSGPDFLARLEGRLTQTAKGLESFVFDDTGITLKTGQSRVDYKYFSSSSISGSKVRGLPSWFRIDSSSGADYNVTELME